MKTKELDLRQTRTIALPPSWRGRAVLLEKDDLILVKKVPFSTLSETRQKLKILQGKITDSEISQEVRAYRKG